MKKLKKGSVLILDFGSQYTQLIARRVRENNVYSEILPPNTSLDIIMSKNPKAIILSGGPASVFTDDAPTFDENILNIEIPILGICYGLHLLVHHNNGIVESTGEGEYGFATIKINKLEGLCNNMSSSSKVWMSHMDQVTVIPKDWETIAHSSNNIVAALANKDHTRIATQFHPEVSHTEEGNILLNNFLFHISKCERNWTAGDFIKEQITSLYENHLLKEVYNILYDDGEIEKGVTSDLLRPSRDMLDEWFHGRNELIKGIKLRLKRQNHFLKLKRILLLQVVLIIC